MDCYEIWVDLAPGEKDLELIDAINAWLQSLQPHGVKNWRIKRRKLGFGPSELGEFYITIEFESLADLDRAFHHAAKRTPQEEVLHAAVYSKVINYRSALYRDFPDKERVR